MSGKTLSLPCAIGDTIYWMNGMVCGGEVSHIEVDITDNAVTGCVEVPVLDYIEYFRLEDFNKTWFLSKEDVLKVWQKEGVS